MKKTLIWTGLFAVAMGYVESTAAVYLREIFYPLGFSFPLQPISVFVARIEFFRELATMVMLVGCGIIAGKTRLQRFAFFAYTFAIWDIFYYVFLYVCLGWPPSLSTWDVLFLIPVPWVGPVWAPCLLSLLMIAGSVYIIYRTEKDPLYKVTAWQWVLMLLGSLVCIFSFMYDYLQVSSKPGMFWWALSGSQDELFSELKNYVPVRFNCKLFFTGFFLMCTSLVLNYFKQAKK